MTAIPLRELSEEDRRSLIGNAVTVKVYDSADDPDPGVQTGRVAFIAVSADYTVVHFEHQPGPANPWPADWPVTVDWA